MATVFSDESGEITANQDQAVQELDLQGLATQPALALLKQTLTDGRRRAWESLIIHLDSQPATGEQDNLLVPVGLHLAWARSQGLLLRHVLLAGAKKIKFFVEFTNPTAASTTL